MCNSKIKAGPAIGLAVAAADFDGRAVLQPACNRVALLEATRPPAALKKTALQKSISFPDSFTVKNNNNNAAAADVPVMGVSDFPAVRKITPPASPTSSRPITSVLERSNDVSGLTSSTERLLLPRAPAKCAPAVRKKSKKSGAGGEEQGAALLDSLLWLSADRAPGSIAAAQREQTMLVQAQRKMRIAQYGRAPKKLEGNKMVAVPVDRFINASQEEKRCSLITSNSDPVYIAYHDDEWGVPIHDDKMLFELLTLSGAQVGLDWTTILKKRNHFRAAFAGFDPELVSRFTERQMASISAQYELDLVRIRGVVNNGNRILEVRKEFASLDRYLWGFVNNKPIVTNYKSCRRIPVKTSKSESMSKDMVRRGFRFVGPTAVHSFMQAAGLTNDHLVSCPRHQLFHFSS